MSIRRLGARASGIKPTHHVAHSPRKTLAPERSASPYIPPCTIPFCRSSSSTPSPASASRCCSPPASPASPPPTKFSGATTHPVPCAPSSNPRCWPPPRRHSASCSRTSASLPLLTHQLVGRPKQQRRHASACRSSSSPVRWRQEDAARRGRLPELPPPSTTPSPTCSCPVRARCRRRSTSCSVTSTSFCSSRTHGLAPKIQDDQESSGDKETPGEE